MAKTESNRNKGNQDDEVINNLINQKKEERSALIKVIERLNDEVKKKSSE